MEDGTIVITSGLVIFALLLAGGGLLIYNKNLRYAKISDIDASDNGKEVVVKGMIENVPNHYTSNGVSAVFYLRVNDGSGWIYLFPTDETLPYFLARPDIVGKTMVVGGMIREVGPMVFTTPTLAFDVIITATDIHKPDIWE